MSTGALQDNLTTIRLRANQLNGSFCNNEHKLDLVPAMKQKSAAVKRTTPGSVHDEIFNKFLQHDDDHVAIASSLASVLGDLAFEPSRTGQASRHDIIANALRQTGTAAIALRQIKLSCAIFPRCPGSWPTYIELKLMALKKNREGS